jgi:S-phase kinase-associated protein 1
MAEPHQEIRPFPPLPGSSVVAPPSSDELEFTCARDLKVTAPKDVMVKFSKTVHDMIDDFSENKLKCEGRLTIADIEADTMDKIVSFCVRRHQFEQADSVGRADHEVQAKYEAGYFVNMSVEDAIAIVRATNYLDIKVLLDEACREIARRMRGKTPEGIQKMFKITEHFTPDEEEEIRRDNPWLQTGD